MKTFKLTLSTLVAVAAFASTSHADFVINWDAGQMTTMDGEPLPVGSMLVMLADLNGDGDFGDLTDPTSFAEPGDAVLALFESNDPFGFIGGVQVPLLMDAPENTPLAFRWYATPFVPGATGPGEGVEVGQYTAPELRALAPGDTLSLNALTPEFFGTLDKSVLQTSAVTIPEPASVALLGLGGLLIARRRRA